MKTLIVLDFSSAVVTIQNLPAKFQDRDVQSEEIEEYIQEELGLRLDEVNFMFGNDIEINNEIE